MIWGAEAPYRMGPVVYQDASGIVHRLKFHHLHVMPEAAFPVGRKGLVLHGAWMALGRKAQADGMLIVDGDVAIDPVMAVAMLNAIHSDPEAVWTAPVKIWPESTHRDDWVWSHWEKDASQEKDEIASYFSFCFTYLPASLMEACVKGGLQKWTFPNVDACVAKEARKLGLKARMVDGIEPVHLHW